MKKRRFIRRMLRPSLILIYALVIAITSVICTYAFGGLNAALLQVKANNLSYDYSLFENINDMNLDNLELEVIVETSEVNGTVINKYTTILQYIEKGLEANKKKPLEEQEVEAVLKKKLEEEGLFSPYLKKSAIISFILLL